MRPTTIGIRVMAHGHIAASGVIGDVTVRATVVRLTFEATGRQQWASNARTRMYRVPPSGRYLPAVAASANCWLGLAAAVGFVFLNLKGPGMPEECKVGKS